MTAPELIAATRQRPEPPDLASLFALFAFCPTAGSGGSLTDAHLPFRTAVAEALLPDFTLADRPLILRLFAEEMRCEHATWEHDNLYQLCFYLYELGQLADCFLLYAAKFEARNMDVGVLLDRDLMTVGHEPALVRRYVRAAFAKEPQLARQYPQMLAELQALEDHPDYASQASYREALRGYFSVAPAAPISAGSPATSSGYLRKPKPWWKFW